MKNSDSDYKAEDEGSATETKKKTRPRREAPPRRKREKEEEVVLTKEPLSLQEYGFLEKIEDAPEFSLNNKIFFAKVCRVIDGDTFKAIVFLLGVSYRFTFRMNEIDSPELRKGEVKEFGKLVKSIITEMISGKIVKIEAGDFDKYGRILARVYVYVKDKPLCLNDFLLDNAMAKYYTGKEKTEFTCEDYAEFREKYQDAKWPETIDYPYS